MTPAASGIRDHEWLQYYERFDYFSAETVRDHCHPRIMEHNGETEKAIVLVHGLTDSPYFMTAIAEHFYQQHEYNVYLPLLHFHGLKDPRGMEGVKLAEWKANVNFAVDWAASKAREVSIGGLSTGGVLSFYTPVHNPKITGTLYLVAGAKFEAFESSEVRLLGECAWLLWPVGQAVSSHPFDILAEQMAYKLTQVEAPNRTVSRGQCRLILFHPAAAKLAAMFGVADQWLDA